MVTIFASSAELLNLAEINGEFFAGEDAGIGFKGTRLKY
jgi:hypothetical protein